MADVSANSSTTARLEGSSVAGGYSGALETVGDHDWIRIDVLAGVTYQISADLAYSQNSYDLGIFVRHANGSLVQASVQNGGVIQFTADAAGPFYLDVSSDFEIAGQRYDLLVNTQRTIETVPGADAFTGSSGALVEGSNGDDDVRLGDLGVAFGRNGADVIQTSSAGGSAHGGVGDDVLFGADVGDLIWGGQGDDEIVGNGGNDTLYGDQGQDVFFGGTGNDKAFGGELEDQLIGNDGDDTLDGGSGADRLEGGAGSDLIFVGNVGDLVIEFAAEGNDTVAASASYTLSAGAYVELLRTTSNAGTAAINLAGNELSQSITGNAGANVLNGRAGHDTLTGLGGHDAFVFDRALSSSNYDHVVDFAHGVDKIRLDHTIFTTLPVSALPATAFKDIASGTTDSNDRILYKHTTGGLYYDADGSGGAHAAQLIAILDNHATLTAADFLVIA